MLRSEEIKQEITNLKNEMKSLRAENKIDEAHLKITEIENLQKELDVVLIEEKEIEEDITNKIKKEGMENMEKRELNQEEVKFLDYLKEGRPTVTNAMTAGSNGAIIPTTIAEKVIERAIELSPIVEKATRFVEGSDMKFVKESTIPTFAYVVENNDSAQTDATFVNVTLGANLASAECLISKSLINRSNIDVLDYVINAIAKALVKFLEKELIVGTTGKCEGLLSTTNKVETATVGKIIADELIDVQALIPTSLQVNAEWIINPADYKSIRKLKGTDGQYLCGNMVAGFGFELLGKKVNLSDQMPVGKIFYGDMSGLYVKFTKNVETQILNEKYASKYAQGVLTFVEVDSKIVEDQKLAKLEVKAV